MENTFWLQRNTCCGLLKKVNFITISLLPPQCRKGSQWHKHQPTLPSDPSEGTLVLLTSVCSTVSHFILHNLLTWVSLSCNPTEIAECGHPPSDQQWGTLHRISELMKDVCWSVGRSVCVHSISYAERNSACSLCSVKRNNRSLTPLWNSCWFLQSSVKAHIFPFWIMYELGSPMCC